MAPPTFGIFDHIEDIPGTPTHQLFQDRLDLIGLADEAGFAGFHLAEHHGSDLCMAPNEEVFIAAASTSASAIVLQHPTGDMTLAEARRTMDLFVSEVKPQLEQASLAT